MLELLKDRSFAKRTLNIMLPVAAQQLISIGVSTMDSIMLGSFGEIPIAATSLANSLTTLFFFMFMGLGTGSTTLAAQFWGNKDKDSLKKLAAMTIRIALVLGVVYCLAAVLIPGPIMHIFTNDQRIIDKGISYLSILGFTFPFNALATSSTYLLRSTGHTKTPLISSICAFFINVFFNWVFIFGKLGAPQMEIAGAAVGTLIARIFEFAVICGYLFLKDKNIGLRIKDVLLRDKMILKKFISYSLPLLFSDTMLALGLNIQGVILGHMSADIVAARSIVMVLSQFVTVFNIGLSTASGVVIGNTIGEGDVDRAFREGKAYILLSIAIGFVGLVIVLLIYPWFLTLYNVAESTKATAREIFLCISLTMPLQTLAYVTSKGILRGAGDTKFISFADITLLWVVSLPLGAIAGLVLHLPAFWTYFFLTIEFPAKGIWCTARFLSGKSIRRVTDTETV
ncbi:MAG: MATE family efflux transporter [Oscillospiraceae bacterium]|nr:MATE family efflux transporter [Oscillospiraceae bacterium]